MKLAKLSACILAVAALGGSVFGQTAYASRFHTINAGIVILRGNPIAGGYANDAPHIWNNLDQDTLVKPAAWNFENPLAPAVVTADVLARWPSATGTIRKDNAAYWEVNLANVTDAQLAEFDVLALPVYRNLNITGQEMARLRRFMDNGGILWADVMSTTTADVSNALPLPFQLTTSSGTRGADFLSPLMSRPFNLSMTDLRSTEFNGDTGAFGTPGITGLEPIMGAFGHFTPVAVDGGLATIGASAVGNGYLVVTTRGVGRVLNEGVDATGAVDGVNNNYQAENVALTRATVAAGKLIINAISLNSGHTHVAQGPRSGNGSLLDLGAPLLPSFTIKSGDVLASDVPTGSTRPPVFYKGLMVVTTNTTLYVYSAKPGTTLDGSGAIDYGLTDYSKGTSADLIWKATLTGPLSSPTCAEVPDAPSHGLPKDQIFVYDGGTGKLCAFDAFQYSGGLIPTNALLTSTPVVPAYSRTPTSEAAATVGAGIPNAPTFHEGVVYVTDTITGTNTGRVWMLNPSTGVVFNNGTDEFEVGKGGTIPTTFSSGPTVGYIPVQDNSGAMDKVVYVPGNPLSGGSPGGNPTASIFSFWAGVKGEAYRVVDSGAGPGPTDAIYDSSSNVIKVPLRCFSQSLDVYKPDEADVNNPLNLHISLTHADGHPYATGELTSLFTGHWVKEPNSPGTIPTYVDLNLAGAPTLTDIGQLRVDYAIDWGAAIAGTSVQRGFLNLPDDTNHGRTIIGNLALTPNGNLIAVLSQGTPPLTDPTSAMAMHGKGGSVYNFAEKGRGIFKLNYRFEAYDSHAIQTNQGTSINYPEAFTDNDPPLVGALSNGTPDSNGVLPNAIKNLTFTSPPTVRDGVVYVTAVGWKNTSDADLTNWIPVSVLIALKENPDPVTIFTGDLSVNFQIVQPDICSSDDKSHPTHFAVLQPNQYTYTKNPGDAFGTLTFSSLMDRDSGPITNAVSTNQPLLLRQAGSPDQILEPNQTAGANWNPMLWYAVFPGYHLDGASMVTGDTLFSGGWSVLPGLLTTGITSNLQGSSVASLVGFNAAINSNDSGAFVSDSRRPWQSQAHIFGGSGSSVASSNLLWPGNITDAYSIGVRVGQEALFNSKTAVHIAAGDGIFAATGDNGLYAFDSSSLLVADASRVGRYSPSGDTLWSSEATLASASLRDVGAGSLVRGLVTPVRAYPFKSDTLIVDAGANRIIRMADTGREVRSIDSIKLDADGTRVDSTTYPSTSGFRPDGFKSSEPLTFNRPSDVSAYAEYVRVGDPRLGQLLQPISSMFTWSNYCEYWVHYFVADSANHRLVDVIDRYLADKTSGEIGDPILANETVNGATQQVAQVGILLWHSPSSFTGRNWAYNSIARTQIVDASGVPHDVFAAGVGNAVTSSTDLGFGGASKGPWVSGTSYALNDVVRSTVDGTLYSCTLAIASSTTDPSSDPTHFAPYLYGESTGNGSIVLFGYGSPVVINQVLIPAISGNIFWNGTGFGPDSVPAHSHRIGDLSSVTISRSVASNYPVVMFTDSSGVYEATYNGSQWTVQWMLPNNVYSNMRGLNVPFGGAGEPAAPGSPAGNPIGLHATYARRLDEDHVLLVNGLVSGDFKGEVVVVSGAIDPSNVDSSPGFGFNKTNLGFGTNSIRYQLQDVRGSRAIQGPVFADRR